MEVAKEAMFTDEELDLLRDTLVVAIQNAIKATGEDILAGDALYKIAREMYEKRNNMGLAWHAIEKIEEDWIALNNKLSRRMAERKNKFDNLLKSIADKISHQTVLLKLAKQDEI